MRNIVLYIAVSLDGYIADSSGQVDWIAGEENGDDSLYMEFVKTVDTIIMGWNTYYHIITELSPGAWVYRGMKSYVITHRNCESTDEIQFVHEPPCQLVKRLKQLDGKDIWICGGAGIARQLIREDLIDRYHISIVPTLLGGGIRLFEDSHPEIKLQMVKAQNYHGIMDIIYQRRSV